MTQEEFERRISKARDSFDSKYGTYLVKKVISGKEIYKIYDKLKELMRVENISKGAIAIYLNTNEEYNGMWIYRLSTRRYSIDEQLSFMQKNISLDNLLAIISLPKEVIEEAI